MEEVRLDKGSNIMTVRVRFSKRLLYRCFIPTHITRKRTEAISAGTSLVNEV